MLVYYQRYYFMFSQWISDVLTWITLDKYFYRILLEIGIWVVFFFNYHVHWFVCIYEQRSKGIGFIRLHIPWPILSREAELQKIKVAVKKVQLNILLSLTFYFILLFWINIWSSHGHLCVFCEEKWISYDRYFLFSFIFFFHPLYFWAEMRIAEEVWRCWNVGFCCHQAEQPLSTWRPWHWHPQRLPV